jgi:hypothetical protein
MSRRSYSGLLRANVYLLYDKQDELVGSCRARSMAEAQEVFGKHANRHPNSDIAQKGALIKRGK